MINKNNENNNAYKDAGDYTLEDIIAEVNADKSADYPDSIDLAEDDDIIFDDIIDDLPTGDKVTKAKMEIFDWVQCIVGAIIVGIVIFIFVGRTIGVEGISMMNTLSHNDRVVMSNFLYTPQNGDIIVFQTLSDDFGGAPLVKRVIALENQVIDINFDCGHIFVDGILQCEPFISEPTHVRGQFEGPHTVQEGHIFVLGDNRNHSSDSRDPRIGEVDTRQILGKVLFLLIPGPDGNGNRDWDRFGAIETLYTCHPSGHCICDVELRECGCGT